MKRSFEKREFDSLDMANCLMLLSKVGQSDSPLNHWPSRVFTCKTCNREFPSFQALGGHRASHKKPRLMAEELSDRDLTPGSPQKPKTHGCSICGLEFAIGQALGGHMRRHRPADAGHSLVTATRTARKTTTTTVPVLKKSNSKRVMCLDLNLMPWENESDLKLQLGKSSLMQA